MPLYKPLIFFYLTVSCKFLSFQIFLLFVSEMSASITSYIVQIIYIALAWVIQGVTGGMCETSGECSLC